MAKVLCVFYDDPATGFPETYARDSIPVIKTYSGGQVLPTPKKIDFKPGRLLGSVSGGLGLRNSSGSISDKLRGPFFSISVQNSRRCLDN